MNVDTGRAGASADIATLGGVPYVAWEEYDVINDGRVYAAPLTASGWAPVLLNINAGHDARIPTLGVVAGSLYATWSESDGTHDQIRVKRLDGTTWTSVGGSLNVNSSNNGFRPRIADIDGVPYVAWNEYSDNPSSSEIRVKRFNGSAWTSVGGLVNDSTSNHAGEPSIVGVAGTPYVAYDVSSVNFDIVVKRLSGTTWVPAGTPELDPNGNERFPELANINGKPWIVYGWYLGSQKEVYAKEFDGTTWNRQGGPIVNDPSSSSEVVSHIASVGGVPFVSWAEEVGAVAATRSYVKQLRGGSWTAVGAALNVAPDGVSYEPRVASIGGVPYVSWSEHATSASRDEVRVKRLEPDVLEQSAAPGLTGATLAARVNDYGVSLPVGFEVGPTAAFGSETELQSTGGVGETTVSAPVAGLAPATAYVFRAFGSDTFRRTSLGPAQGFSTLAPALALPEISGLTQAARRWRLGGALPKLTAAKKKKKTPVGTTFSFRLNVAATARLAFTHRASGRKVKGRCVKTTHKNRKRAKCKRTVADGTLSYATRAGTSKVRFRGRLTKRKRLRPGRHGLTVIATDPAGRRSAPATLSFTIVRR